VFSSSRLDPGSVSSGNNQLSVQPHGPRHGWDLHPGVRSYGELIRRDRAADLARDLLGTWTVAMAGVCLAVAGIVLTVRHHLPAVTVELAGLAVLALSVLLMTARRRDQITAEVALYELESDRRAAVAIEELRDEVERLRGDLARLTARLQIAARPLDGAGESQP
jgi:hypothetical protein